MNFRQFVSILRARMMLMFSIVGVAVALAVAASVLMPARYTTTAQVLLDVKSQDPLNNTTSMLPAHLLPSYIASQAELVTSPLVAERVVDSLQLDQDPAQLAAYNALPEPRGDLKKSIAADLAKKVTVKPTRDSNMLLISYTGRSGEESAKITNGFVKGYIDTTVALRVAPARQTSEFYDEQAKRLRANLNAAQEKLLAFQRSKGITTTDERMDAENARLLELSTQLTALQGSTIDNNRRRDGNVTDSTEVLNNPVIIALKAQQNTLEAQLNERASVLGPNHPDILRRQSELQAVRNRLTQETAVIAGNLQRNYQTTVQRTGDVKAEYEKQRARVLEVRQARDQMVILQRDVTDAQRSFDSVSTRLNDATLESRSTQANIVPIVMASPPTAPTAPNPPLYVLIAVVLGSILALATTLVLELLSPRVRVAEDLFSAGGAVVMGEFERLPAKTVNHMTALPLPMRGAPRISATPTAAISHGGTAHTIMVGSEETSTASAEAGHLGKASAFAGEGDPAREALIDSGLVAPADAIQINAHANQTGLRFGDAAIALGHVTKEQVTGALARTGQMPLLDASKSPVAREVVAAFDGHHPFLDELRSLRSMIKSQWLDRPDNARKSIAIVSHSPGEGKSFTAANLAVSFVQMGERTLLIDGDMRRGRLHALFALDNSNGLSTLLALKCSPQDAVRSIPGMPELSVITAGPEVPNATDLLARDTLSFLLDRFAQAFDVIIIDTPSSLAKPDAALIAGTTKGAVLVAKQNKTLSRGVESVAKTLRDVGATLVGSVLVKA